MNSKGKSYSCKYFHKVQFCRFTYQIIRTLQEFLCILSVNQGAKLGFLSLARGAVGLNNLMKTSLALANFLLARLNFHWPRAPGQLLRSQTE